MPSNNSFFHPMLRFICVAMIFLIVVIAHLGPKEERIRTAEATVTSVEYKQESKTKGPLTEYQYLTASYEVDGQRYNVTQRNEMPSIEYRVEEKFPVFYDERYPQSTINPEQLPGKGNGKFNGSDVIAILFMLPFILTLLGSFVYVYEENKKDNRGSTETRKYTRQVR
jgi:uncharacterized membrane protein